MPNVPKVSVVIAAYNQAQHLPQALESVLAQDLDPELFEVVVVDDGSTDETPAILNQCGSRIIVVRQTNQGLPAACNAGFATARGGFIARLDADDFVAPAWLRRELEVFERTPKACCVYPDYVQLFTDGALESMSIEPGNLYSLLACGTMVKADAIRAVGGVRTFFWEEYDLYLRLQEHGTFVHVPEPLYVYRRHDANMTNDSQARQAGWRQLIRAWGSERLLAAGSSPELTEALTTTISVP